jgi:hypothetical protein
MGAKRGASGSYADFADFAAFWLKIAFIVVAPVVSVSRWLADRRLLGP